MNGPRSGRFQTAWLMGNQFIQGSIATLGNRALKGKKDVKG